MSQTRLNQQVTQHARPHAYNNRAGLISCCHPQQETHVHLDLPFQIICTPVPLPGPTGTLLSGLTRNLYFLFATTMVLAQLTTPACEHLWAIDRCDCYNH